MMRTFRTLALGLIVGTLLTSCASNRVKAEAKKAEAKKATEDSNDYVYVYPIGSHIPVKVKKQNTHATENDTARAQEALRNVQQSANVSPAGN